MKKFLIAVGIGCLAQAAWADFTAGSKTAALFGGIGGSSSEYDYQPGTREPVSGGGGAVGGQFLYYVKDKPAIGVGVDINASMNGDSRRDDLLSGFDSTARLKSTTVMALARLAYPRGVFRPYLFGGLGVGHAKQTLTAHPRAGNTWPGGGAEERTLVDESRGVLAIGYGIGADFFFTESFFFGTELRGTLLGGLDTDDTAALKNAGFNVHEKQGVAQGNVLLRLGVKF